MFFLFKKILLKKDKDSSKSHMMQQWHEHGKFSLVLSWSHDTIQLPYVFTRSFRISLKYRMTIFIFVFIFL